VLLIALTIVENSSSPTLAASNAQQQAAEHGLVQNIMKDHLDSLSLSLSLKLEPMSIVTGHAEN
jgi:hypothetical protein